jgi:F-type H+-transporting ATPase subunit b
MFEFDATLPLMAVQFLLLAVILNAVFYKPLMKTLDERDEYIRKNKVDARDRLSKAQNLVKEYESQISEARRQSQSILEQAQLDAKKINAEKMAEAQREVQAQKEKAAREIEEQKQVAMSSLEQKVDGLSRQILEKILGAELVK